MSKKNPQPELAIPPDGGGGDDDPPFHPVRITSVSPIGGIVAGGFDVTITGTGFQPDAEVFFGATASPEVTFVNGFQVIVKAPAATQVGSVDVRLVNPDGTTAVRPGAFTYVTNEGSLHAEVLGVTPLSVIEDTESEITIRGRNLITAYNDGIVALRGPGRVQITSANFSNSHDDETGIELLTLTVRVTATPPLEQQERIAIQVLAAVRAQAANNGVFDSSRQMFTVLPRAVPVLLAYTANLTPGQPSLVLVAGKNLSGCSLSVGKGASIHLQQGDNETLAGIVSVPADRPPDLVQLTVLDSSGSAASQLDLSTAPAAETKSAAGPSAKTGLADKNGTIEPLPGDAPPAVNLTPVPGQSMVGPTKTDSATFSLGNQLLSPSFLSFDFEFVIFELDLVIPLFNEVRLIPFFDNGVGDVADTIFNSSPILAQAGKLLRLRGVGLLVALRVDLLIHMEVVLIVSFNINIWPWGFYNEFPDYYPWAFGSIVISIYVIVQVFLLISFLVALVEPLGHLRVLFYFNLILGVDFELSTDGHVLSFHLNFKHKVIYSRVAPFQNFLPCGGNFQLAEENGQTVFLDNFGGSNSFYFPRAAGQCCLPWDFDLQLIRFEEGGPEETIQGNFRTEFCLNAAPPTNLVNIIITSEHPAPTGIGLQRHLEMAFNDLAHLIVLAEPADANGNPTGPAVDITTLGYEVEFYLDPLYPDLFNPVLLPSGEAMPVQAGNNFIHARIHSQNDPELFNFRPDDIFGFVIQRYVSQGLLPGLAAGILPVTVQDPTKIVISPTLAYRDAQDRPVESPSLFVNQGEAVREVERFEPFEYNNSPLPQPLQRIYTLAARISFPAGAPFPQRLTFTIDKFQMKVRIGQNSVPEVKPPLENTGFSEGTTDSTVEHFFFKRLTDGDHIEVEITSRPAANELIELKEKSTRKPRAFEIAPNIRQAGTDQLVPPGKLVADRQVMLFVNMTATSDQGTEVADVKQLKMAVRNDETYEEYLRVFPETRALVRPTYDNFVKTFFNTLPAQGPPSESQLNAKGLELWNLAVTDVQTSKDDRSLYWTRLQSICALRAYYKRNRFGTPPITQFEWPSRGLDPSGSISFGNLTATVDKAIVTGFDPFALARQPTRSNPSGLVAIALSGKPVDGVTPEVRAITAVFPVRYRDFDASLIETAVSQRVGVVRLIMSCSLNSATYYYDVERWASRARSTGKDNENKTPTASVPGTADFTESTLPYEGVITAAIKLAGPNGDAPFVADQSYKVQGVLINGVSPERDRDGRTNTVVAGKFRPEPLEGESAGFLKQVDRPVGASDEGSGGNYLSNEIFYRIAKQRDASTRKTLASGHFHLPDVLMTTWDAANWIAGVKDALKRFLNKLLPLRTAAGGAAIPVTPVTRTSQTTILVGNDSTASVTLASAETQAPFSAQIVGSVPVAINPGGSVAIVISFTPTGLPDVRASLLLKDSSGGLLGEIVLVGEGSAAPPAPTITSFSPTQGLLGDTVMIVGTNLDGATSVKVGSVPISITSSLPTQIEAEVIGPPRTGAITVTTPSGTATSSQTFRVIAGPHHPPDF